jgi:hypothetical protein
VDALARAQPQQGVKTPVKAQPRCQPPSNRVRDCAALGAGYEQPGDSVAMARPAWMKREQWLIWIVAATIFTLVMAAISYRLLI